MRLFSKALAALLLGSVSALIHAQTSNSTAAPATDDCRCEIPLPDVLAIVNGIKITRQDLSPASESRIKELRAQVIEARERELDLQINSMLLDAEAKRRGVTTKQLLETEVVAKISEPTEADAQTFFDQNKARMQSDFASAKNDIIEYLRSQRQKAQAQALADRLRAAAQIKLSGVTVSPAATPDRARVLATVNGRNITAGDIENGLGPLISSFQEQAYTLRKKDVDLKINDLLLDQEAKRRQITTKALLDTEVNVKVRKVTDAEAQKFYDENKARINGEFAAVKPQLFQYLEEEARRAAQEIYATKLRSTATLQMFLKAPEPNQKP